MNVEMWLNNEIRFVEVNNEWWAIASDVCNALGLKQVTRALKGLKGVTKSKVGVSTGIKANGTPAIQEIELNIINEKDIYRLVFKSRKKEAEEFQDWVFEVIKELRKASGLQGFEIFRQLDKEHQKENMKLLRDSLRKPVRVDFIKANTITNKAISTKYGHKTMVKKANMTPQMLIDRDPILEDTVELMGTVDKFKLPIKVSETIYKKYN